MSDTEPLLKGSWPLTIERDGRLLWHVAGTNPPQYAADDKLEALWREGQKRTMQPYYDKDGITIWCCDWRAIEPPDADLVLADPPYGMNYKHGVGATKNGKHPRRGHLPSVVGDNEDFDPAPVLRLNKPTILWGANHYANKLPPSPAWYVWDKRDGIQSNDNSDCELAWTNIGGSIRIFRHTWNGVIRASENGAAHMHGTQKPVALMRWCLQRAKLEPGAIVFDPYMGSGPVAAACRELGYRYIGCDLVEQYCQAAVERVSTDFKPAQRVDSDVSGLPLFAESEAA